MRVTPLKTSGILCAAAGLALASCGRADHTSANEHEPASHPSDPAQAVDLEQMPPATRTPDATNPPAPTRESGVFVGVSANGGIHCVASAGWPVVIEVNLLLRPDAGDSLTLSNPGGAWSDALELECTAEDGADKSSLFRPAFASETSIELTADRSGLMVWVLESIDPKTLPDGTYRIRTVVDEAKLGGTVPPGLASDPITLVVAPDHGSVSAGSAQRKCMAVMAAAAWMKNDAQALAASALHLEKYPKDVAVLFMQGRIQHSRGQDAEALASFAASLLAAEENKEPMAENFMIEDAIAQLGREMAAR